ncbi:MAG: hypothetical protein ACI4QT_07145 [Kiritimatiellia bacterium]
MAKIELTETGLKLPAINAGDEIGITVSDSVEMADDAAYRVVVLGPIRGGGRALIAVSGKLQASCRTGAISLQTTQARDLFRPLLPTDSLPARVEVIDEGSGRFVAGSTTNLRNSFALWSGDAFPAQSFLAGDTFSSLRAAIDAHESRRDNPHGVTAEQIGAEPLGMAQVLIDIHDGYPGAHPDIQQSIANMDSVCRDYIAAHNESQESHSVLRSIVEQADGNANTAVELATHAESTAQAAIDIAIPHVENRDNPHGVTAAQVGAITPQTAAEERHDYKGKTYHTKDDGVGLSLDWPMPAAFIVIDDDSTDNVSMGVDMLFSNIGETTDTDCEIRRIDFAILNKTNNTRRIIFETHDPVKCPSVYSFPYSFVVPKNGLAAFRMNAFYYNGEQYCFENYEEY